MEPVQERDDLSSLSSRESCTNETNENKNVQSAESLAIKKIPIWRILLLSAVGGAVDLGYAVEGAYSTPLLVAAGMNIQYATIMLALSPIAVALSQAYLGTLTDRCPSSWGRRRPFILLFSLTLCVGLGVAPFAPYLSHLSIAWAGSLSIIITVTGVFIIDFSLGQLQLPSRAYLLDSLQPSSQVQPGNFIYSVLIGLGTLIGFILSGIDWVSLFNRGTSSIINQAQFVFAITAVLIIICLVCTLLSVKEIPYTTDDERGGVCCISSCPCAKSPKNILLDFCKTIYESLKFVWHMSGEMWLLWVTVLFGFFSNFTFLLFFTTFVGMTIYGGYPTAPIDSKAYVLYTEGVRMGSWALAVGAAFLTVMSLLLNPISKAVGLRTVFLTVQYLSVIALFVISVVPNLVLSFIVACFVLLYQGVFMSIPYTLLSVYQVSGALYTNLVHLSSPSGE